MQRPSVLQGQETRKSRTEEEKLVSFRRKVRLRAAKVQRQIRIESLQWQKEVRLPRHFWQFPQWNLRVEPRNACRNKSKRIRIAGGWNMHKKLLLVTSLGAAGHVFLQFHSIRIRKHRNYNRTIIFCRSRTTLVIALRIMTLLALRYRMLILKTSQSKGTTDVQAPLLLHHPEHMLNKWHRTVGPTFLCFMMVRCGNLCEDA